MNQQVVMITGASKGLGKALALAFAKEGARLAISARGEAALLAVAQELQELGAEVLALAGDMADANDVDRFVSITEATFGRVDVLINNASVFGPGPSLLLDYTDKAFADVLRINVMNPFLVTKRVLPGMLTQGSGSIINVTSEAGKTGFGEWGAYGISKFAVEGLTQTWADELAGTGVRMNMVDPGEMDTEMHAIAVPDCDYELGNPEESTAVFLYLASEKAAAVNGQRFQARQFGGVE
ncbi:SDR family NAD(P)-dependent oxidoreductase [Ectobacillus antri]|jgi:NAD(P)-dependent dehydrogenase (short-subunit alcohol dehydrogenase family)|uniref:SDR family NAD(P)-dependent oxidoreductase n=1 Tax=Ectobacillus antri TaxID=2486280 RepID=A0ABT6H7Y2_9BACI|nr:SDR family oxidoreductase [Ectobacillus antri]MDG4658432.1 SDR family NAD(P)-dependent oxidoreductase [Ectobacillus antri]MDG5755431.1 SDR family NAD(P)-dependent oxidoreductase [Ectobacillus antri]